LLVLIKVDEDGSVHSALMGELFTDDYEIVSKEDLMPGASLKVMISGKMCSCEFMRGSYTISFVLVYIAIGNCLASSTCKQIMHYNHKSIQTKPQIYPKPSIK